MTMKNDFHDPYPKAEHLPSFSNRSPGELGHGLFTRPFLGILLTYGWNKVPAIQLLRPTSSPGSSSYPIWRRRKGEDLGDYCDMKPNSNDVMDSSLKQLSHFLDCYKFRVVYCYG